MSGAPQSLPPNAAHLLRRAFRAQERGAFNKAEQLFASVLRHDPYNFDALHGLARMQCRSGHLDTALVSMQTALRHAPTRADGFATLGLIFHLLRRFQEALVSYDETLSLDAENRDARNGRGVTLLELRQPLDALADFEHLLARDPADLDALGNLGNALIKLNRPEAAIAAYDRALALTPNSAELLTNRAVALRRLDRPHEALMSASRALAMRPDFAPAQFVEGLARLTLGDFAGGWSGYEARWSVGSLASQRRGFTAPPWAGLHPGQSRLDGKTILLHAEQGFGDTLQFVRYVPLVAALGAAKIVLEVQPELRPLLSGISGADVVLSRGDPLPHFDLHCPLLSLPLCFATDLASIPGSVPYIAAPSARVAEWRERLPRRSLLVGIAWSGERGHDNDLNRSLPLAALAPLFDVPGVTFVALQHDLRDSDRPALQSLPGVLNIGPDFVDFVDTAAVVSLLDAVVSADTAVAHLAGAMGKPLLLMLPFAADFRWLRERHDSPWYPTARLYRQQMFGDWTGVVAALRRDLLAADSFADLRRLSA